MTDLLELTSKVVIVTGASSGSGAATAPAGRRRAAGIRPTGSSPSADTRYPIEDAAEAFRGAATRDAGAIKVIIEP